MSPPTVHRTANVESGVEIGDGTRIWDNVHIRENARIGRSCIIGEKTYVAYDVKIGDYVKVNAAVYICTGVTIEDFCMLSAHVVFTNDRFPRAGNRELTGLETSEVGEETLHTHVGRGATVGANATIGPGVTLGEFSMVGMGAVVTRDVPPHGLVVGSPARLTAWVCHCGPPLVRLTDPPQVGTELGCERCGRRYAFESEGPRLLS